MVSRQTNARIKNLNVLNFWKKELGSILGFNFDFETRIGTMEQDPYRGGRGNAIQAFFTVFTPKIMIGLMTERINETKEFLCKVAEYICNESESILKKSEMVEATDDEYLCINKIKPAFVEYYLLKMKILKRNEPKN